MAKRLSQYPKNTSPDTAVIGMSTTTVSGVRSQTPTCLARPFPRTDSLAHEEWIRQDQLHVAILIRLENQFVRSISLEERHWTHALPVLWLAVWSGELWHFDVSITDW